LPAILYSYEIALFIFRCLNSSNDDGGGGGAGGRGKKSFGGSKPKRGGSKPSRGLFKLCFTDIFRGLSPA